MHRFRVFSVISVSLVGIATILGSATNTSQLPPVEQGWRPPTEGVDYGPYPKNYKDIVKGWYASNLKDPDSAKFVSFSEPMKEHAIENQFRKEAIYGYAVCATVNAKNSYGGYTGAKTHWFLISNGQVVRSNDPGDRIYVGYYSRCK